MEGAPSGVLSSKARLGLLLLRPDRVLQTDAGCDTQTDLTAEGAWLSRNRHPAVRAAREAENTPLLGQH
jgi:hypothetical protein